MPTTQASIPGRHSRHDSRQRDYLIRSNMSLRSRSLTLMAGVMTLGVLFLACSGSAGPSGEAGDAGLAGAEGAQGEQGQPGPAGERGDPGAQGDQGFGGPEGPRGEAGPTGLTGGAGPTGPRGAGDPGPTGTEGPEGPAGETGATGATGSKGEKGEPGPTGGADGLAVRVLPPLAHTVEIVDTTNSVGFQSSITIGSDGFPAISYRDGTNGDLKFAHCGNATCSNGNTITTLDSEGVVGFESSIAIGLDGFPIISYRDITESDLKVVHCGSVDCASGNTITVVDDLGRTGEGTSIAIGSDGLPIISFRDHFSEQLRVTHCGNALCSENNLSETIDSDDLGGYQSSLAIGADGLPIIAYRVGVVDNLRIIHCGNVRCSNDNIGRTLDSAGSTGFSPSLAIGSDGLPAVAYKDGSTSDLNFIRCDDLLCIGIGDVQTLDDGALTGFEPSMAIGPDGLPIISYQDASKENLVFVHCGDVGCTSGVARNVIIGNSNAGAESSMTIGPDGLPLIAYFAGSCRAALSG